MSNDDKHKIEKAGCAARSPSRRAMLLLIPVALLAGWSRLARGNTCRPSSGPTVVVDRDASDVRCFAYESHYESGDSPAGPVVSYSYTYYDSDGRVLADTVCDGLVP